MKAVTGLEFRQNILKQIEQYLNGEITKEEYYDIAEPYYTRNAGVYDNKEFHKLFLDTVADACLIYIDEPGLLPEKGEALFYKTVKDAYDKLIYIF